MAINIAMFGKLVNMLTIWGMRELDLDEMCDLQNMAENIKISTPIPAPYADVAAINELMRQLLNMRDPNANALIPTIKAYREVTGAGLKEAKDWAEKYREAIRKL